MKIKKRLLIFLAILAAIAAMVITAPAQRGGFQAAGIAPPVQHQPVPSAPVAPFTSAPVAPFVTAPVGPFGTSPFATAPGGRVLETFRAVPAPVFFPPVQPPAIGTVPGFRQHNGFGSRQSNIVIVNVGPAFPQQAFPQTNIGLPAISPISIPQTISMIPATIPTIPLGTSRAQVISQFGPPSVTVITSASETLYFNGGVTVIIQNGQVVTGSR
jgi:hypothetical protein